MEEQPQPQFRISNTSATRKVFSLRKRIRAVAGGTSASKTISILIWLIDYCGTPQPFQKLASVVSESYPHLKKGAMLDFETIMKDRGYWSDERWNKTDHVYTFETGHRLEFLAVDTYGKAHGLRRDVLFINEANNMPYNIVDQLIIRTREVIWMDWNPTSEFWFYSDMLNVRDDIDFITLTYLDNEALDQTTKEEIETHKNNRAWWQVYGLGQLGQLERRIYINWDIIETIPREAQLVRYGVDFGYTNDPTVIEAIYRYNNSFIIDEVTYLKGLSNKSIADILLNLPRALTYADSAEPKSIDEIASYGIAIMGAHKGPGSVFQGIQYVQAQKIAITSRSVKTIKAYRNYLFLTNNDGKTINEPDDTIHEWSNSMDAIRYGLQSLKATLPKPAPTTKASTVPLQFIPGIG